MQQPRHPLYEDLFAYLCATTLVSTGVMFLYQAGLITGGTTGIALLLERITPLSFGLLYFLINLPFYILGVLELGRRFTINTVVCVSLLAVISENIHHVISIAELNPMFAATAGSVMMGFGLLILFRHQSSLGGVGILAYFLQSRHNIRAGNVAMVIDVAILFAGAFVVDWKLLAISVLGAVVMNAVLTVNHKPGRYQIS